MVHYKCHQRCSGVLAGIGFSESWPLLYLLVEAHATVVAQGWSTYIPISGWSLPFL